MIISSRLPILITDCRNLIRKLTFQRILKMSHQSFWEEAKAEQHAEEEVKEVIEIEDAVVTVRAESLKEHFRSKFDIYKYLSEVRQAVLPPYEETPLCKSQHIGLIHLLRIRKRCLSRPQTVILKRRCKSVQSSKV